MDSVNHLRAFSVACARCGRALGRWELWNVSGGWTVHPLGRPGTDAFGRAEILDDEERWPRPAHPRFRWNNRGKLDQSDALDLTCSCRGTYGRRRQFRISAAGLARKLAQLGWPAEVSL